MEELKYLHVCILTSGRNIVIRLCSFNLNKKWVSHKENILRVICGFLVKEMYSLLLA